MGSSITLPRSLRSLEPIKTDDRPSRSADTGRKRFRIGSDVEIAKRVADDLNARHGEVIFSEGDFWFYDKTHWRRIEKHNLRRAVHNYDGGQYPIGKSTSKVRLNKAHGDSIIHEMGVILARAPISSRVRQQALIATQALSGSLMTAYRARRRMLPSIGADTSSRAVGSLIASSMT
jgi:hypothetical protein